MFFCYKTKLAWTLHAEVKCVADGEQSYLVAAADNQLSLLSRICWCVQVYESKLQELQKQVETISLVAETPDEEELDEEEEEEGMSSTSPDMSLLLLKKSDNMLCSSLHCPES